MSTILLIEDEAELRELIQYNLERMGHKAVPLANANDALIVLEDVPADLILLDIMLPGLNGIHFLEIIRRKGVTTPVIILSARNGEHDLINALEKGADDYITKPFSIDFLEAKVNAIMRRSSSDINVKKSRQGIYIDDTTHKVIVDGEPLSLTQKEYDLLSLLIANPQRVYTRNQILNSVWGYDNDIFTRTVDAHIASLRKKLGERGRFIKSVPKIGYCWED
ncbi:MAG: response regulator transcription factor [Deferribacteraceae bacterium]|nr:response regulator transcription factor [Deferribacteraceae bacterium]